MKKTIAIIVPHDCEVLVLKPGQATMGRRIHKAIIVGTIYQAATSMSFDPPLSAAELAMVNDWHDCQFLTRLAPGATVQQLEAP